MPKKKNNKKKVMGLAECVKRHRLMGKSSKEAKEMCVVRMK